MIFCMLVHRELNICHFLLRTSANFKTVWWFFTNLGKPKFDIILFLPEHFIWGLMSYLCTVWGRCLGCQMVWQTEHHRWHNSASNNCQLLYLWAIEPCYLTISGFWSFKLSDFTSKQFSILDHDDIFCCFTFKYFQIC